MQTTTLISKKKFNKIKRLKKKSKGGENIG